MGEVTEKGGCSPGAGDVQSGEDWPACTKRGLPRTTQSGCAVPHLHLFRTEVETGRPLGQRDKEGRPENEHTGRTFHARF